MSQPNPFLEILDTQGSAAFLAALKAEPLMTPALRAAIVVLELRQGL